MGMLEVIENGALRQMTILNLVTAEATNFAISSIIVWLIGFVLVGIRFAVCIM